MKFLVGILVKTSRLQKILIALVQDSSPCIGRECSSFRPGFPLEKESSQHQIEQLMRKAANVNFILMRFLP